MRRAMTGISLAGFLLSVAAPAAAGPNALGCFTRTYDRAHLARHPDQLITALKLLIHKPPPPDTNTRKYYWFRAQFNLRGRQETLRTSGFCTEQESGLRCIVDCDGGGVDVVPRARDATMYLDRIRAGVCGGGEDENGEELTGGKDDRVFRLDRVNDAACAGMKR
jgi:hypothetical protein